MFSPFCLGRDDDDHDAAEGCEREERERNECVSLRVCGNIHLTQVLVKLQ